MQQFQPQFLVGHFPAPETQGHLHPVTLFQKLDQLAQLDLVVTDIGPGPELDFLDLGLLLFLLGSLKFLAFLKPELALINDSADRWLRVW